MTSQHSDIKARLQAQLPHLLEALFHSPPLTIGREYRYDNFGGTTTGDNPSLAINRFSGLWIEHNPTPKEAISKSQGDILDLIAVKLNHTHFHETLRWAAQFLGLPGTSQHMFPAVVPAPQLAEAKPTPHPAFNLPTQENGQFLQAAADSTLQRATSMLWNRGEPALNYLRSRGLADATIRHFHVGMKTWTPKDPNHRGWENALYFPLMHADGRPYARFHMASVPEFTKGAEGRKEWGPGSPHTYWATPLQNQKNILVVEGHRDAWRVWQAIQGSPLQDELAIITSSHGSGIPKSWHRPNFWASWQDVYAGQDADDAGDALAEKLRKLARREVHRARPPGPSGADWTDVLQSKGLQGLLEVLSSAEVLSEPVPATLPPSAPTNDVPAGKYNVKPVDINGAWVGGHLYYPYRVLVVTKNKEGQLLTRYQTEVLRSDGHAFTYSHLPAPDGTPVTDRVLALDDGTIIKRAPTVIEGRQSWSHTSIVAYQQAIRTNRNPVEFPPHQILERMEAYLRSQAILPNEEDYALLTYIAAASYCQRIYEAVPLVLVTGVAGSGKSEIGRALTRIGANGLIINGQTSAATAAREIDRTAGIVVFDDLEAVGRHSNGPRGGDFSDLIQQLKVSYKASTSTKSLTIMTPAGARTEVLDFYGIKVVTNTTGTDPILGSRMLVIRTKRADATHIQSQLDNSSDNEAALVKLRDSLHAWTMHNAGAIHKHYRANYASSTNRHDEITAPLRTLADLMGHTDMSHRLDVALKMQEGHQAAIDSYDELLHEALRHLVRRGYTNEVSLTQLEMEMVAMAGPSWGVENTTEIPRYRQAKWIGETLRNNWWVDSSTTSDKRRRLWGTQTRVYKLAPTFVSGILKEHPASGTTAPALDALAFCVETACRECPYRDHCSLQPSRIRKTGEALN